MKNENVAMPMDHELIRNLLRDHHQGKRLAICQADLAAATGIRKRRVRKILRDLILQFGEPIGSLYTRVGGYFWITSKWEGEASAKAMTDHLVAGLARVAAMKGITLREFVGQLELGV